MPRAVRIIDPGSYRLTGNLTVPDGSTTAIRIAAGHVTIDLNGFSITGPAVCSGQPVTSCTNGGSGDGIVGENDPDYHHITVRNGEVRGMGNNGIDLRAREGIHLDGVRTVGNAGFGISVGENSHVSNCLVEGNEENGILAQAGSQVWNCTVIHNGSVGITLGGGTSIVRDSSTINNGNIGLTCGSGTTDTCIVDSVISSQNQNFGMTLGSDHALLRGSNITANTNGQVIFNGEGGYVGNVISGTVPAVSGAGAVELGQNLCNGNTTCP